MKKCLSISRTPVQKALDLIRSQTANGSDSLAGQYRPRRSLATKEPIRVHCSRHASLGEAMMREAIRRYAENAALGRNAGELR